MSTRCRSRQAPLRQALSWALVLGCVVAAWSIPAARAGQPDSWACRRGDGGACDRSDLADPRSRQILVLSAAYPDGSAELFWDDFDRFVDRMSSAEAGDAWSAQKRDRLLYLGVFTGGGPLGSDTVAFGGRIMADPLGAPTLGVRLDDVQRFVDELQGQTPSLHPLGAAVLFRSDADVSPRHTLPSFSQRDYGVALLTSKHIEAGPYVGIHEMAHAALGFVDEYVESGFEPLAITQLDVLTPRLRLDWTLPRVSAVYDYRLSEILAGNGSENLALRRDVTTVRTPGVAPQQYEHEGGLFFGRGTFHDAGSNLMNSGGVQRGPGDDFAFAHSPSQQQFIDTVFGDAPGRPNDRLRNAGPVDGWNGAADTVDLLLYDADKNNRWHPTRSYTIQVGWFERGRDLGARWRIETYTVPAEKRTADLPLQGDRPEEQTLRLVACRGGMTELSTQLNGREVCEPQTSALLPTFRFYTPYERATVPASQWFTRYWWRFSSSNGVHASGWTTWSSFYRSF